MTDIRFDLDDVRDSPNRNLIEDFAKDIAETISKQLPKEVDGQVWVRITGTGNGYMLEMVGFKKKSAMPLTPDGMKAGEFNYSIVREFNLDDQVLKLDTFIIDKELQGRGISRKVHGIQLKYADKFSLKGYRVDANMDVGGYAWIKAGMAPNSTRELRKAYQMVYDDLDIADSINPGIEEIKKELDDTPDAKLLSTIRKNPERYKTLFLGSYWEGGLDFDDKEAKDLLDKYINPPSKKKGGTSRYYVDVATRHQVYLERYKAGLVQDYEGFIRSLDEDISELLSKVDSDTLKDMTRKEYNKLLRDLRSLQLGVYSEHTNSLLENLEAFSGEEADFEVQAITTATANASVTAATGVWSAALEEPIQATGELLDPFLKGLNNRQILRIENQLRISRAQGMTISQTVRAIRGTKQKKYRDGILGKNWGDARTVVRTATQHVSSQARTATWMANDDLIKEYQWVSTLDGVTSKQCRSLDTQVFKIGEGPLPPIHPNCRSTHVPYFRDTVELFSEDATRSAEFGPVKADTSYYQWLKRQPKAFQDDAIGPVRAKLLREGGLSAEEFSDLQLDKNFQPLTLAEMRALKPNAFEQAGI